MGSQQPKEAPSKRRARGFQTRERHCAHVAGGSQGTSEALLHREHHPQISKVARFRGSRVHEEEPETRSDPANNNSHERETTMRNTVHQEMNSRVVRTLVLGFFLVLATVIAGPAAAQGETAPGAQTGVVNINTADVERLQFLPRVGPAVAQRIIEHREQNGAFREKADLLLVRGIGEATFERLAPYVTLEGDSTLSTKVPSPRAPREKSEAKEAGASS